MSVSEISDECNIPLSSTYQHVKRLCNEDLLREDTQMGCQGNSYHVYKTKFEACFLFLDDGEIREDVCIDQDEAKRLIWLWKEIRDSE